MALTPIWTDLDGSPQKLLGQIRKASKQIGLSLHSIFLSFSVKVFGWAKDVFFCNCLDPLKYKCTIYLHFLRNIISKLCEVKTFLTAILKGYMVAGFKEISKTFNRIYALWIWDSYMYQWHFDGIWPILDWKKICIGFSLFRTERFSDL